ncbi:MAG: hypothetical protein OXC82_12140 [Rhodobacteraceae bacterium]|nr:hypothetical protein [Paracoccaceae bacterium]MCY4251168.1 hypothetical protein [Paracoccaceae bacterium]
MRKHIKNCCQALLASMLLLAGSGTVSADSGVSLCEYWYGAANTPCISAFKSSHAGKNGCKITSTLWSDWNIISISRDQLDAMDDETIERLAVMKETYGHHCGCNIEMRCQYIQYTDDSDYYRFAITRYRNFGCTRTLEVLRSMTFNSGHLTPSCKD